MNILSKDFLNQHYVQEEKSCREISEFIMNKYDISISVSTIHKKLVENDINRNSLESRLLRDKNSLDYNKSYLREDIIEAIDGFLLGDGSIDSSNKNKKTKSARLTCGLQYEEFCNYFASFFQDYGMVVSAYKDEGMSSGVQYHGRSRFHPDFFDQYIRWYNYKDKQPPDDVRITPTSLMMWYLGDGSVVVKDRSINLRLSTDSFLPEKVKFLVEKLKLIGINSHRNNDNRIVIQARSIPVFFDFIGKKSPVKCYDYKFKLPDWRFESIRMKEAAKELQLSYNRLSHLVKIGKIECLRLSKNGRPRFLKEHLIDAREYIKNHESKTNT